MSKWEPADDFQESDEDGILLTINDNEDAYDGGTGYTIILQTTKGASKKVLGYDLPADIRLCRLVETPEQRTAKEFVGEVMRRAQEGSIGLFDDNLRAAFFTVAGEWGLEEAA